MKKGTILIAVLIMILFMSLLVATLLLLVTQARILGERYNNSTQAIELAESGVEYAIWEMNYGNNDFKGVDGWSGTNPKTKTINDFHDGGGNIYGNISISVTDPMTADQKIVSTGTVIPNTGPAISRIVRVEVKGQAYFRHGILTSGTIKMSGGAFTDSYNSVTGGTGLGNGDVVTNGSSSSIITMSGGSHVYGNAATGPGGTIGMSGGSTVASQSHSANEQLSPITAPASLQGLPSEGSLNLSKTITGDHNYSNINLSGGKIVTITGNTNIYVTDQITLSGGSRIDVALGGISNVYVNGNVAFSGGSKVNNATKKPLSFNLWATNNCTTMNLSGGFDYYGTVYAPNANLNLSGGTKVFGSVVGKTADLSGGGVVHFDENLLTASPIYSVVPFVWQEK